jgi:acyl carrier protein
VRPGNERGAIVSVSPSVEETIRSILGANARLAVDIGSITDDTDLFGAGMTSHASVNVMLALEDAFDIEFPERMLKKSTFESVSAIRASVLEMTEALPGD